MIQPEFKALTEILSNKLFRIPEYQRHYSWKTKQRKDLFEDIIKLRKARFRFDDRNHFMATIVCLKTKEKQQVSSSLFYIYDVVDGQQRLTTLIVLLKAISEKLKDNHTKDNSKTGDLNESIELNKLLVKDDGRLILLQNNHDNRNILRNYLKDGNKPVKINLKTTADENLAQAITDCETFINEFGNTIDLLALVKNNLYFIFQSLEDKGAVYTIFEVLNSRGLDVDWLDKCKSMLMGLLYEFADSTDDSIFSQHLIELQSYWSEIYREIGLQNISGEEIIRFASTLKKESDSGSTLNSEESLDYFRESCSKPTDNNQKINNVIENTVWLKEITSCLSKLYQDYRRNAVTDIIQSRLLAVAIMLRKDLREEDKNLLLEQWERTTFRIYGICGKDSRTKRGDFVRAAKLIQKDSSSDISGLLKIITSIDSKNEYEIEKTIKILEHSDCYNGWQKELRYFFYRFEEYLSKELKIQIDESAWLEIWKSNINDSIEHIFPQDKSNQYWNSFTNEEHKEYLNKLGNLCMLSPSLNSQAQNKSFTDKKVIFQSSSLLSVKQILNKTEWIEWNKYTINQRTNLLLDFAKLQWKDVE